MCCIEWVVVDGFYYFGKCDMVNFSIILSVFIIMVMVVIIV